MSYAQRKELSGNRTLAIILIDRSSVGGLVYAIVTGLAYNVIKKAAEDLKTFDVEEQPPPPEEPPPPPKDMPKVPPPPMTPPPLVRMEAPPPPIADVSAPTPPPIPPVAPAPPPPPAAAAQSQFRRRARKGDLRTSVQRRRLSGVGAVAPVRRDGSGALTIGAGRPRDGLQHHPVDAATARSIRRPATFFAAARSSRPARDSNGNPTTDTITTPPIVWRLAG